MCTPTFLLENLEITLPLLKQQFDKNERDLLDVKIYDITIQLVQKLPLSLEQSSESVYYLTFFLWLKSKKLLPKPELSISDEEDAIDPLMHTLAEDYTRFKQIAKQLEVIQKQQQKHHLRGIPIIQKALEPDLVPIPLEELTGIIHEIIKKSQPRPILQEDSHWNIQEKINDILLLLSQTQKVAFERLFSPEKPRMELIVTFLALLELIKRGKIVVVEDKILKNWVVIEKNG